MKRYEYRVIKWFSGHDEVALVTALDEAGRLGWEAMGLAPRGVSVPMPGMGAKAVP